MIGTRLALATALLLTLPGGEGRQGGRSVLEVVTHGHVVWQGRVAEGEGVALSFIHSAELCRWTHHYQVRSGEFEQYASSFGCFGAGMPVWTSAIGRSATEYMVPAHLRLREIPMIYWAPADITLQYRDHVIPLGQWLEDWEAFQVRIR